MNEIKLYISQNIKYESMHINNNTEGKLNYLKIFLYILKYIIIKYNYYCISILTAKIKEKLAQKINENLV